MVERDGGQQSNYEQFDHLGPGGDEGYGGDPAPVCDLPPRYFESPEVRGLTAWAARIDELEESIFTHLDGDFPVEPLFTNPSSETRLERVLPLIDVMRSAVVRRLYNPMVTQEEVQRHIAGTLNPLLETFGVYVAPADDYLAFMREHIFSQEQVASFGEAGGQRDVEVAHRYWQAYYNGIDDYNRAYMQRVASRQRPTHARPADDWPYSEQYGAIVKAANKMARAAYDEKQKHETLLPEGGVVQTKWGGMYHQLDNGLYAVFMLLDGRHDDTNIDLHMFLNSIVGLVIEDAMLVGYLPQEEKTIEANEEPVDSEQIGGVQQRLQQWKTHMTNTP